MQSISDKFAKSTGPVRSQLDHYIVQNGPELLTNIVLAILILVVGQWLAKMVGRLVVRMLIRAKVDETLAKFLSRIAQVMLMLVVVVTALSRLGIETTSLTAAVAAAGLAVGLALQGPLCVHGGALNRCPTDQSRISRTRLAQVLQRLILPGIPGFLIQNALPDSTRLLE